MLATQTIHIKNIYYGDMKAPNCLIFRNQELRIGDLGISVKLEKHASEDEPIYEVKGLTAGFSTEKVQAAYDAG